MRIAFLVLLTQNVRQTLERVARIHRTGGVIGRIDDDGSGLIRNGARDIADVYLEGLLVCKHLDTDAASLLDPHAIFGKIRSDDDTHRQDW